MLRALTVLVPAAGGNGAATGTVTIGHPNALLMGVNVSYGAGQPATDVVTITNMGRAVLTTPAANTNKYFPVVENSVTSAGVAAAAGDNKNEKAVMFGDTTVAVSGANADPAAAVTVTLILEVN